MVDDSLSGDVTSNETPNELTTDDSLIDRSETLTRPQPEPTEFLGSSVSAQAENVEGKYGSPLLTSFTDITKLYQGLVQEVKHLPKESVDSPVEAEKDIVNPGGFQTSITSRIVLIPYLVPVQRMTWSSRKRALLSKKWGSWSRN